MRIAPKYQWNEPRLWRFIAARFRDGKPVKFESNTKDITTNGICCALSWMLRQPYYYDGPAFDLLDTYEPELGWWPNGEKNKILRARMCEKIARHLKKFIDKSQAAV